MNFNNNDEDSDVEMKSYDVYMEDKEEDKVLNFYSQNTFFIKYSVEGQWFIKEVVDEQNNWFLSGKDKEDLKHLDDALMASCIKRLIKKRNCREDDLECGYIEVFELQVEFIAIQKDVYDKLEELNLNGDYIVNIGCYCPGTRTYLKETLRDSHSKVLLNAFSSLKKFQSFVENRLS